MNIVPQQTAEEQGVGLGPREASCCPCTFILLPSWWGPEEPAQDTSHLHIPLHKCHSWRSASLLRGQSPAVKYAGREELTLQGLLPPRTRAGGLWWPLLERRQSEQRAHVPLCLPLIGVSVLGTSPHTGWAVTNGIPACQAEQQDL